MLLYIAEKQRSVLKTTDVISDHELQLEIMVREANNNLLLNAKKNSLQ